MELSKQRNKNLQFTHRALFLPFVIFLVIMLLLIVQKLKIWLSIDCFFFDEDT